MTSATLGVHRHLDSFTLRLLPALGWVMEEPRAPVREVQKHRECEHRKEGGTGAGGGGPPMGSCLWSTERLGDAPMERNQIMP